jgi:hypothetical protein
MQQVFRRIFPCCLIFSALLPMWHASPNARGQDGLDPVWNESDPIEPISNLGTLFRWNGVAGYEEPSPPFERPLASDRPDFTEASSTVGRGITQIEMGYTRFFDDTPAERTLSHSFPEILLRQGIGRDWLELRVGWTYNSQSQALGAISGTAHGADDLYLGAKLALTPQQSWLPEMALVPQMTVPVGGPFSAQRVLPGINWLYGWDINEQYAFGGSTQYNLSVDEFTRSLHGEFAQSFTIGRSWTERLHSYVEWFLLTPVGADSEGTEHYFDGGLTYLLTENLQLDIRIGKGVSADATDYFTGAGVVIRF